MIADNFDHEEVDLVILDKSTKFLEQHVKAHPDAPASSTTSIPTPEKQRIHLTNIPKS